MGRLLKPGAFLLGVVLILIGFIVMALIGILPEANVPGGTEQNARLLGSIGGAMMGVGVVAMLIGLIRHFRG